MPRPRRTAGFTLIEMLIVVVVGGLMSMIAIRSFSQVHGALGARTAQTTFMTIHAQTRALAVERGEAIVLRVDPGSGVVSVATEGGTEIQSRNFVQDYEVTVTTPGGIVELCMTPRGFADTRCGNVTTRTEIVFTRGTRTRRVVLLPLGQLLEA